MSHRETSGRVRGFTLLELLMVVIIIGILASMALPQYLRLSERARAAEALVTLAAIRSSELRFRAQSPTNVYVADPAQLDIEAPGFGGAPASTLWAYTVPGADPATNPNAVATRAAGGPAGTIEIDLNSGATCNSNVIWGLAATTC